MVMPGSVEQDCGCRVILLVGRSHLTSGLGTAPVYCDRCRC